MTRKEITLLNLGKSLDDLANLDPKGYGVCKLLYKAAYDFTGRPLCLNAAELLCNTLKKDAVVFILTGFVLSPFNKAETDGVISSALLASSLERIFKVKTVIVCPDEALNAVNNLLSCLETHSEIFVFTKESDKAEEECDKILSQFKPDAVISIECPSANKNGRYHNAGGIDVTNLEAKTDLLFEKLCKSGVPNIAIGDLGNEIGMGTIADCIEKSIPSDCVCCGKGGITARTKADNIITATVSDWGCYSLICMLAYMTGKPELMHDSNLQEKLMISASENGLIDMWGEHIPAIDGFGVKITGLIVDLMRETMLNVVNFSDKFQKQFDIISDKNSFAGELI
ncbi:MAG: DUF4392 domain-containing protein [Clostridia bacterium]|nr:DUF4392 domain-containing protein [Clostridia bacterium]